MQKVRWLRGKGAQRKDKADEEKSEKEGWEGGVEKVRCLTWKGAQRKENADKEKSLKGGEVRRRSGEIQKVLRGKGAQRKDKADKGKSEKGGVRRISGESKMSEIKRTKRDKENLRKEVR